MASDITAPSKSREKVTLKPGYHLSNWIRLLDGKPRPRLPLRKITLDEIKLHNTETDCWTILNGKVYDITDYMHYHPGGVKKLMLGAGQDCTKLFNKFHAWVNIDAMIGKCCVGTYSDDSTSIFEEDEEHAVDEVAVQTEALDILSGRGAGEDDQEQGEEDREDTAVADSARVDDEV